MKELETPLMCIEWELLNRKINPTTNRKIKKNGPTYKQLKKRCKETEDIFESALTELEWQVLNGKCNDFNTQHLKDKLTVPPLESKDTDIFESTLTELEWDVLNGKYNTNEQDKNLTDTDTDIFESALTELEWDVLNGKYNTNEQDKNLTDTDTDIFESAVEYGGTEGATVEYGGTEEGATVEYGGTEGATVEYGGTNYKNLKNRIREANTVCAYLNSTVSIADQQWCVSGPDKSQFTKYMESFNILSNGTFGIVSKVYFRNLDVPIIVKESKFMEADTAILTTKKIEGRFTLQKQGNKNYFSLENIILEAIDRLILQQHRSPNFLLFYEATWCKTCNMVVKNRKFAPGSCYLTFMEAADTDLYSIELPYVYQQESVLYQILLGLHSLQKYLGLWHRDIKTDNVFIKRIEPGGVLKYNVDDETYYVQNEGFIVYVADFNVADCLKPGVLPKEYYRLVDYNNGDGPIHPVQVKYINKQAIGVPLKDKDVEGQGCDRLIWKNSKKQLVDVIPNPIPVEQMNSDPIQFPFKHFFGDIQDVIRMFTGGKRSTIDQMQLVVNPKLPEMYMKLTKVSAFAKKLPRITSVCVRYLLAKEMLKTLYSPPPKKSGKFYIIEEFTL